MGRAAIDSAGTVTSHGGDARTLDGACRSAAVVFVDRPAPGDDHHRDDVGGRLAHELTGE